MRERTAAVLLALVAAVLTAWLLASPRAPGPLAAPAPPGRGPGARERAEPAAREHAAPATPASPAPRAGAPARARGHTVVGRVLLASGEPAPGAVVEATSRSGERQVEVALDGSYRLEDLPAGPIVLVARASGTHRAALRERRELPAGEPITVAVDFTFQPGTPCRGRVVDEAGRPVADAAVEAQVAGLFEPLTATSDAAGAFALVLPGEAARFFARAPGHAQPAPVERAYGGAPFELVLELARAGELKGRVLDPRANGFAGVRVEALPVAGGAAVTATTDRAGRFRFPSLLPGAYRCRAVATGYVPAEAGPLELRPGEVRDLGDLRLARGRELRGRVLDEAGAPVAGARVEYGPAGGALGDHVLSDERGTFVIEGLAGEPLDVRARAEGYRPATLRVAPGSADVALVLARPSLLTGVVLDEAGAPIAGAWLAVLGAAQRTGRTAEDGSFALPSDDEQPRTVLVHAPRHAPLRAHLTPGRPERLVLGPLRPRSTAGAATLRGRLRRAAAPVAGALVLAVPRGAASPEAVLEAVSDAEGRFTLALTPGAWELAAIELAGPREELTARAIEVPAGGVDLEWELPDRAR